MIIRKGLLISILICLFVAVAGQAQAFLFTIDILNKEAVAALKNDALVDMYIDVMIELEAVSTFYSKAGMAVKEFEKYKQLLRFRTDLILEMEKREIEIPRVK